MGPLENGARNGTIASRVALRQLYRRMALRCHPDTEGSTSSGEKFWRLVADYEAAHDVFQDQDHTRGDSTWKPCACLDAFEDLISSGFPIRDEIQPIPRGYLLVRERFLREYANRSGDTRPFLDFERDLVEIRKAGVVWNPLFGLITLVMMNVRGIGSNKRFSERAVRRWIETLSGDSDSGWRIDAEAREALKTHRNVVPFLRSITDVALECKGAPSQDR